jgi:hypothetical protein
LISELRRRAYLSAMQVASWLPRVELPFAAPSRPEVVAPPQPEVAEPVAPVAQAPVATPSTPASPVERPQPSAQAPTPSVNQGHSAAMAQVRAQMEAPKSTPAPRQASEPNVAAATTEAAEASPAQVSAAAPPRFTLQLLRAGACSLLVELPNGEPLQGRDPAFLLLKDLLRAAGLPDTPQPIGEPVRWPLLVRGQMDQGPQAALDFVQAFVASRLEQQAPCSCLWLVGLPAMRFAGEVDADYYNRELQVETLGTAWAVPGLELLMEEPERKRELWHAMRRIRQRWMSLSNE